MSLISWLILGALAGWIASKITGDDPRMGIGLNIIVGIIGAYIGGFIASRAFNLDTVSGLNIYSIVISIIGAVILLLIVGLITGKK
ncbi:MAG: GlsB/YeaQ/YmgE family stress response membrane protein [Andreesenia angusta]|nr:GlsB/YeaQ/YmgE family stress response membrane protein [Andreesenia angusta]